MNNHSITVVYSKGAPGAIQFKSIKNLLQMFGQEEEKVIQLPRLKLSINNNYGRKNLSIRVAKSPQNEEQEPVEIKRIEITTFLQNNGIRPIISGIAPQKIHFIGAGVERRKDIPLEEDSKMNELKRFWLKLLACHYNFE